MSVKACLCILGFCFCFCSKWNHKPFDFYNCRRKAKDNLFIETDPWILSMFPLPNAEMPTHKTIQKNDKYTYFP